MEDRPDIEAMRKAFGSHHGLSKQEIESLLDYIEKIEETLDKWNYSHLQVGMKLIEQTEEKDEIIKCLEKAIEKARPIAFNEDIHLKDLSHFHMRKVYCPWLDELKEAIEELDKEKEK